ncbi:MAG TPA: Gfo/Idh/MocA family oxidoreductase, partial [Limnochordia bacterium]|nr:Gfo/Idh/MocA family oxidoreductase [Limnochordia bacterium]
AGVVIEKPMCITTDEATEMIELAKAKGLLLSVFHNRRFDGDYLALKELVAKGTIGRIFRVEMCMGNYGKPGAWWRSKKEISGGIAYDWGAHYLDWLLDLMPGRVAELSGYIQQDLVWTDVTNVDHWEAFIRFDDGALATLETSSIAAAGKPRWRVLGTKGAAVSGKDQFDVRTQIDGYWANLAVPYHKSAHYKVYDSIAGHLWRGEPLAITPEAARRVIGVIDWTERAVKAGKPLAFPFA